MKDKSQKHTSGPWSLHPYRVDRLHVSHRCEKGLYWNFTIGAGKKIIASIEVFSSGGRGYPRVDNPEEGLANARLIIAAPDMLDVLEEVAKLGEKGKSDLTPVGPTISWETLEKVKEIVKQAKS
jgi:hypothetical protein